MRPTPPTLPRGLIVARTNGVVSWLRALTSCLPDDPLSVARGCVLLPVTVAGPRRHCTGFRGSRPRKSIVSYNVNRSSSDRNEFNSGFSYIGFDGYIRSIAASEFCPQAVKASLHTWNGLNT